MIFFSVIIPTLNSPGLAACLAALLKQDYSGPYEIIAVGQEAGWPAVTDARVRFVQLERPLPPGANRNHGIAAARGEALAFIDSDCLAEPDWLSRLADALSRPGVDVVGGGVITRRSPYLSWCDNLISLHDYFVSQPAGMKEQLPSLNLAIRRSALEKVGLFDETRPAGEDSDLCLRLRLAGYSLHFEPRAAVTHCPLRHSLGALLRHDHEHGRYTIRLDPRYREVMRTPGWMRDWRSLLLLSPLVAAGVTAKIFLREKRAPADLATLPVVLLSKWIWCLGAVSALRKR